MKSKAFFIEPLREAEISHFFEWRRSDGSAEIISDLKDTIGGFQGETIQIFIAKIGEKWAGSIKLQQFHEDTAMADGKTRGYLGALEVEEKFRRRGIGRALTQHALDAAKQSGMSEVTLYLDSSNQAARELYLGMGFEKFKTAILHWQGEEFAVDCMSLGL